MTRAIDSNMVERQRLIYKFIMKSYVSHPSLLLGYARTVAPLVARFQSELRMFTDGVKAGKESRRNRERETKKKRDDERDVKHKDDVRGTKRI